MQVQHSRAPQPEPVSWDDYYLYDYPGDGRTPVRFHGDKRADGYVQEGPPPFSWLGAGYPPDDLLTRINSLLDWPA